MRPKDPLKLEEMIMSELLEVPAERFPLHDFETAIVYLKALAAYLRRFEAETGPAVKQRLDDMQNTLKSIIESSHRTPEAKPGAVAAAFKLGYQCAEKGVPFDDTIIGQLLH